MFAMHGPAERHGFVQSPLEVPAGAKASRLCVSAPGVGIARRLQPLQPQGRRLKLHAEMVGLASLTNLCSS